MFAIFLHFAHNKCNNFFALTFYLVFQVLKEILQVLDGTTIDVTRAGSNSSEYLDTSQIFFVCFGNFEEKGFPFTSYSDCDRRQPHETNQQHQQQPPQDVNNVLTGSDDSGRGSGEQRDASNLPREEHSRRNSQMSVEYR